MLIRLSILLILAAFVAGCMPLSGQHSIRDLTVTTAGNAMYPLFKSHVYHYAVRCAPGVPLFVNVALRNDRSAVRINGVPVHGSDIDVRLTPDRPDELIIIEHEGSTYSIRCVDWNFPEIIVDRLDGASEGLWLAAIAVGKVGDYKAYLTVADTNGVPRWWKYVDSPSRHFKYFEYGVHPYGYHNRNGWFIMDEELEVIDNLRAWKKFNTDHHDMNLLEDGSRILISYEKMPKLLHEPDVLGKEYPDTVGVIDSIIQWVADGPEVGKIKLEWNSWDHMKIDNCVYRTNRREDGKHVDYAHANSTELVDGDILVSMRQCSMILMVDGETGEVLWRIGHSFYDDEEWITDGLKPPMKIIGDPVGVFCGQHSAKITSDGNLLLYDNGNVCREDYYSRVVEYELDVENNTATYVREHSMGGHRIAQTPVAGLVEVLDNGNWFIGWGAGFGASPSRRELDIDPVPAITEVNPATGEELMNIYILVDDSLGADEPIVNQRTGIRAYWIGSLSLQNNEQHNQDQ